ncbi:MAG: hypothetical protein JST35_06970 [Armatimonadetes bacterium]|nr:hypothetical protein [Armatimonadota bacterium]
MTTLSPRLAGWSLVLGSVLSILAVAMHPVGGSIEKIAKMAGPMNTMHGVALALIGLWTFGLFASLAVKLKSEPVRLMAQVTGGMSMIAAFFAGTINGFVVPSIAVRATENGTDLTAADSMIHAFFAFNRTLDKVFLLAAMAMIATVSSELFKGKKLTRVTGWFGGIVSVTSATAIAFGVNVLNVKSFGLLVLALCAWSVMFGLCVAKEEG